MAGDGAGADALPVFFQLAGEGREFSNKRIRSFTDGPELDCGVSMPAWIRLASACKLSLPLLDGSAAVVATPARLIESGGRGTSCDPFASDGALLAWACGPPKSNGWFVCHAVRSPTLPKPAATKALGDSPAWSRSRFLGEESSRCSGSSSGAWGRKSRGGGSFGIGPRQRPTGPFRHGEATGAPRDPPSRGMDESLSQIGTIGDVQSASVLAFLEGDSQSSSLSVGSGLEMASRFNETARPRQEGAGPDWTSGPAYFT